MKLRSFYQIIDMIEAKVTFGETKLIIGRAATLTLVAATVLNTWL
jgi:hypothetical protein